MLNEELYWQAIERRDATEDGNFFFGVVTTGVFCRPSCPARLPLRKNVRFYATAADAQKDGLRPCLRCRPLATIGTDPNTHLVRQMCQYIDKHSDEKLSLNELARKAGLSPFHFQRSFKAIAGVTPKQYLEACRLKNLKTRLRSSGSQVTGAIFDAGYGSISRVYEKADTRLGMTPAEYRSGAKDLSITYVGVASPVGRMMIGATNRGICFIQLGDNDAKLCEQLQKEYPGAKLEAMSRPYPAQFHLWLDALNAHLEGHRPHLDLPVEVRATAFQMKVWRYLQSIPYGEVQSYSEVAAGIGAPTAARAVAQACAANTVAIVIPCHRVIRESGELGGYRWGLDLKRTLIDREREARATSAG